MHKIKNPNIPCALRPVPHNDSMPLPNLPKSEAIDTDSELEGNKKWPLHSVTTRSQRAVVHLTLANK
jgi:hypothetical protein